MSASRATPAQAPMVTAQSIAMALKGKKSGPGWKACCPAHDDHTPSLSIKDGDNGPVWNCLAGCTKEAVTTALVGRGLWRGWKDGSAKPIAKRPAAKPPATPDWLPMVPPPVNAPKPSPALFLGFSTTYEYRDAAGEPLFYIRRKEATATKAKQFMPLTFGSLTDGKTGEIVTGWHTRQPEAPRPLYGLNRLAARPDAPVMLCEGEKDADAAAILFPDHVAMAWPCGSQAVSKTDWTPLLDRDVVMFPDADAPGAKAAREVKGFLRQARVVRVDDLAEGYGAADLVMTPDEAGVWLLDRLPGDVDGNDDDQGEPAGFMDDEPITPGKAPKSKTERRSKKESPKPANDDGPLIRVIAGELHLTATAAEASIGTGGLSIYQRGNTLVRPVMQDVPAAHGRMTVSASLMEMNIHSMIDALCSCASYEKWDARAEDYVRINPPKAVADTILSRAGMWTLPKVVGVITTPTIRPDGSILSAPGYDAETRLFHVADPNIVLSPSVERPTQETARQALKLLQDLIEEFPCVNEVSKAVALSGLITPVVRGALTVAPLTVFRASTAGSGKSYLVDTASAIACGRPCPAAAAGPDEVETEKRLTGLLLSGFPLVSLDNVNGELGGDLLCQAIERPLIRVRRLGGSDIIEIESRATLFATGNALRVRGDMTRRTLICDLDANMERPELREFKSDPIAKVMADRGRYISACLVIVRAYILAGQPGKLSPLASFADWSGAVRSALVWLGCSDPAASMEAAREDDPELSDLREVISALKSAVQVGEGNTVKDLSEAAEFRVPDEKGYPTTQYSNPELRDVFHKIAAERSEINTKRLGNWFRKHAGRIVNGHRIVKGDDAKGGAARWILAAVKQG